MMNGKDYTILVSRKHVKEMKRVRFDPNDKILHMHVWSFAYHEARKGDWLRIAADNYRFELRKRQVEKILCKINFFLKNETK